MNGLQYLKSALIGGASALTLASPSAAKVFDIPDGDLATALVAYMRQSDVALVYADNVVRGHKSHGVKGDLTETAALTQILRGTGFAAETLPMNAIGIVPQKSEPVRLAQAGRRTPTASMSPEPAAVETVVVTAQKKTENIQNVPIAVTALSQAQLTERQIAGGPDLVKEVPNLTFSKTNFTGYNIEIRGIGTQAISVTTDPAVAVAFNDIPFIRNHFFEQEFYDLQDAEVLRGPQGTLYGRNATAGVVNIKSALPDDSYQAMLSADIGNYSNRRLEGMLNLPLDGDTLDLRIAGEWTKRDGYSFNEITGSPIDGRDLWSSRMTLGWKPSSDSQVYLVWEHFSEDDDRMRTAKQLCKTAPIPETIEGVAVNPDGNNAGEYDSAGTYLSQGCLPTSLYSPDAFEVPNGFALPYYGGLEGLAPLRPYFNVYGTTTQSQNLRVIDSTINPHYRAKNDTLELNANYQLASSLMFTSQTGYNNDYLYSTEDYNRFNSAPGAFVYSPGSPLQALTLDPLAGTDGIPSNSGVFCDPQLGCSDRLVAEDVSDEHAWQFSQEFRLSSNFSGPLNFSFGVNYLHYETDENYYVFINSLTLFAVQWTGFGPTQPYVPNVSDNSYCLYGGFKSINPSRAQLSNFGFASRCIYIDPNPLADVNNEGHNYFLSQNPYALNSYAGFGEVYYQLMKDIKLTGGLRWTDDQKHFTDIPSLLLDPGYGYAVSGIENQQWDQWTGRFAADWTPQLDFTDQTLVYGSFAHGYKAGGANPPGALFPLSNAGPAGPQNSNPIHPLTFAPEFIDAFELGSKNTMLDGALTLNGDAFFYIYHDYQISEIVDRTAINNNFNAHVKGTELEATWEPAPGLKFSFAGGYENATLDNGQSAVDLIDRTAGHPGWMVVKPFISDASNCILPDYVVAALLTIPTGDPVATACGSAYVAHLDPVTGSPYTANPTGTYIPAGYPGFDPVSSNAINPDNYLGIDAGPAPNNGQGFDKNIGGNQLPNAPHFTTSLTAEYTIPVSDDWAATLHSDFYWQSQSWARVFNDNPYDKLHGYSNVNLALILSSDNGWQVMGYVKNLFDVTAITGDFLNSDDSGLTTNVFLTDPRLYGVRVTKQLDQNDGFWGSDFSGAGFFTNLFADTDGGRPPLWIELGGLLEEQDDAQEPYSPGFASLLKSEGMFSPSHVQSPAHFGLAEEASISFQPEGDDWVFSASIRYGRSKRSMNQHQQTPNKPFDVRFVTQGQSINLGSKYASSHVKFADATAKQSESHTILDFQAGKDVGVGMLGNGTSSIVSGGVRIAQFSSKSSLSMHANPDVHYPTKAITNVAGALALYTQGFQFHSYAMVAKNSRSFHGIGPSLSWKSSMPVDGNLKEDALTFDWGVNAALLFGRQKASGHSQTIAKTIDKKGLFVRTGYHSGGKFPTASITQHTQMGGHNRARTVAVPNLGGFIGLSMKYNSAKISFGYRADEFFGAMDGGIDTYKSENVGFFGPYANISIGLGG